MMLFFFFYYYYSIHGDLPSRTHSFHTRRTSGLLAEDDGMAIQIPTFNYTNVSGGIEMLAQQMTSQTHQAVRVEGWAGERQAYDQIGSVIMGEKEGRAGDIPTVSTPHARRWVTPRDFQDRKSTRLNSSH